MKYTYTYTLNSGVTLGGIGAGCFELRADGRAYEWHIFNNGPWASRGDLRGKEYLDPDSLFFAVRIKDAGRIIVRILRAGEYYYGASPYTLPWLKPIESIEYVGKPPFAILRYHDKYLDDLIDIELEAFSPFIPGDLKNSSLPAAIFRFKIRSKVKREIEISLLAGLRSPFETSEVKTIGKGILIKGIVGDNTDPRYNGSIYLGLLDKTPSVSIITAPIPIRAGDAEFSKIWVEFRSKGLVEGKNELRSQNIWVLLSGQLKLKPEDRGETTLILTWFFPNHMDEFGEILGHYYENFFKDSFEVYEYVANNYNYLYGKTKEFHDILYGVEGLEEWVADLVGSQLTSLHKLTWLTKDGRLAIWEGIGDPYYGGPGGAAFSTTDVATYIIPTLISLFPELAKEFVRYNAKYQLTRDSPWYLFYALTYSENRALFVEMLKKDPSVASDIHRALEVVKEIVRKTGRDPAGRVMHFFGRSIKRVDQYHMIDLMPKFILDVYLIATWTEDRDLLEKLYDNMKLAYESIVKGQSIDGVLLYHTYPAAADWGNNIYYQGFGAGLPDPFSKVLVLLLSERLASMGYQTFDGWTLYAVSAYTSILWLGALKALEETSRLLGSDWREFSEKYRLASNKVYEYLWNGEYFRLWYDPISRSADEACMAAQLFGQWLSTIAGLGYVVDEEKTRSALKAIARGNLVEDEGLINGIYLSGARPAFKGQMFYENLLRIPFAIGSQMDTPWTGVEFVVASHMLYEGMLEEALKILRELHERYVVSGHYWNHVEWGDHYMRSLSSWSIVMGTEGLIYNGFTKALRISPAVKPLRWVFAINGSWGLFEDSGKAIKIEVRYGTLRLKELRLVKATAVVNIETPIKIDYEATVTNEGIVIRFKDELELKEGDRLMIHYR